MTRGSWRLPGYRIEQLLGTGSSGEVWRARVTSTGVPVAVKRIWLSDRAQRDAALSEAAMLGSLDHPHLMKLHEVRHVDDAIVLVLDLAAGGSLASLLDRRGRLTVGEAITALAPIGAALAYAHNAGVVHGDVSPANVLFTDIGLPLLADLGVARLLGDAAPVRTTPAYADPTVAAGGLPGPTGDVFMLGGVALHALTGTPPWPGTTPDEVLEAAAAGEQPDFAARMVAAGVPGEVVEVVARALRVEPAARGTAADFALDLRHAAEPVAVELSAGRARVAASTRRRVESWPVEPVPADAPSSVSAPVIPFAGEPPLTYGVRAPTPFASPPGRHLARGRPRIAAGFAAAVVTLAAAIVAGVCWWPFGGGDGTRPAVAGHSAGAPPPTARATSRSFPRPSAPAGASRRIDARDARAALAGLDAARSAAFARRDPALLTRVYASDALLARDRALLTAIVPVGCGLRGVRTRFSHAVLVSADGPRVRLRVTSAVTPSTLVCGGVPSGRAAGTAATRLIVDLVRVGSSYRIAAQRAR